MHPRSENLGGLTTLGNSTTLLKLNACSFLCAFSRFFRLHSLALCEFHFVSGFEGEVNGAVRSY